MPHDPKLRLRSPLAQSAQGRSFSPALADAPPLPVVDFSQVGATPPQLLEPGAAGLPQAHAVVLCWTSAEWAAFQHVFCAGSEPLPYSARTSSSWPGWQKYAADLPSGGPQGWDFWGEYRLVEINGNRVLLFKSNTHLDYPGASFLQKLIGLLIAEVQPSLIVSTGTAGGARPTDHIGTVRAVSAGTLYETGQPQSDWPDYANSWHAPGATLANPRFAGLLNPIPSSPVALDALTTQFNQHFGTRYALSDLDPLNLNLGDPTPLIADDTGGATSLLTTTTFVVATTDGTLAAFSAVEMDDAIIAQACGTSTAFGFVRNISDPAQPAALPRDIQGSWGSAVYDVFGFYTSFNGALAAWAMIQG